MEFLIDEVNISKYSDIIKAIISKKEPYLTL